jgi:hypothetical protein
MYTASSESVIPDEYYASQWEDDCEPERVLIQLKPFEFRNPLFLWRTGNLQLETRYGRATKPKNREPSPANRPRRLRRS